MNGTHPISPQASSNHFFYSFPSPLTISNLFIGRYILFKMNVRANFSEKTWWPQFFPRESHTSPSFHPLPLSLKCGPREGTGYVWDPRTGEVKVSKWVGLDDWWRRAENPPSTEIDGTRETRMMALRRMGKGTRRRGRWKEVAGRR